MLLSYTSFSDLNLIVSKLFSMCYRNQNFKSMISSVNETKSTGNSGFGHIYWRNPLCQIYSILEPGKYFHISLTNVKVQKEYLRKNPHGSFKIYLLRFQLYSTIVILLRVLYRMFMFIHLLIQKISLNLEY